MTEILEAIAINPRLSVLDISRNNLSASCMAVVLSALADNNSVTYVDLSGNKCSPGVVLELIRLIRSNTVMSALLLEQWDVTEDDVAAITDSMECNYSISTLRIDSQYVWWYSDIMRNLQILCDRNRDMTDSGIGLK